MRVVIAEDSVLLREGLVALLREHEVEVVAQTEDGESLLRIVAGHKPDLAIVDVRLPPSFTDEGIRAAAEARRRHPSLGVLILSQYVEPVYTAELLAGGEGGVGYLLKERGGDIPPLLRALRRAAPENPIDAPSPREREVLSLMAEGRTNNAIAESLVVTPGAVEKHVTNIFGKLALPAAADDHRRVLAVLTFLRATDAA